MTSIQKIYDHYNIPGLLQLHMLRAAAICFRICENTSLVIDKKSIISAALLHDMGNLVKFDSESTLVKSQTKEQREKRKKQQKEFIRKYGSDDHHANILIARELGVDSKVSHLIDSISIHFHDSYDSQEHPEELIINYADNRVSPYCICSMKERIDEAMTRYPDMKQHPQSYRDETLAYRQKQEQDLFSHCSITPESITEESCTSLIEELRLFDINTSKALTSISQKKKSIEIIKDIAKKAGKIILQMKKKGYKTMKKSDTGTASDYVTEADLKADEYIRHELKKHFPKDQILTEETVKESGIFDRSKTVRIVDPVDGTKNFADGKKEYGVLIGRCINGKPELGVCYFPETKELFHAQKGQGAFYNDKRINSSNKKETRDSICCSRPHLLEREKNGQNYINKDGKSIPGRGSDGCFGRTSCQMSKGENKGIIGKTPRGKRDTCAPQVIIEEVGYIISDIEGKELDYKQESQERTNGIIATTKEHHQEILDFLHN